MAVPFVGFSWWFWSGGSKDKHSVSKGSFLNSSSSAETVKFQTKVAPAKGKGKWQGSEETRPVDEEWDEVVVVVPSDGLHMSGYESDGPEWSVGWEEPHGSGFHGDDGGFAVLVPCYKHGCKQLAEGPNNQLLTAIKNLSNGFISDGSNCVQQWFSSLPNF